MNAPNQFILPRLFSTIFVILCTTSMLMAEDNVLRVVRRHPIKSRQKAAQAECMAGYRERIEHHCRYPDMEQPCFLQQDLDVEKAVEEVAQQCCDGSQPCAVDEFEGLCCRDLECLAKCYGAGFMDQARNRFRYLDILLQPHPESRKADRR